MRKITLRITIALLTFSIGIAATALWLIRRAPKVEKSERPPCQWTATSENVSFNRFPNDIYFPVATFSPDDLREKYFVKGYSSVLAAMNEPSLSSLRENNLEVYRFLWLRSFHPPVVIRLWQSGNEHCMSVKQIGRRDTSINGEYVLQDTLTVNQTRSLTEDEWHRFIDLLGKANFWLTPTVDGEQVANDGAYWVMEGVRTRQYHIVDRQSPSSGDYREACVYLIRISGINVDESRNELY